MSVLTLDGVSIDYALAARRGKKRPRHGAVNDISFDIGEREFVTIVGPSGCGKTSLLRAVAGLVPISAGKISMKERDGRAPFAMVFQQPMLLPWLTVRKNVEYGAREWMGTGPELTRAAEDALELVGLATYADYYPRQLSGGMQQRVNLARAIAVQPDLLVLDEPFSGLDPDLRERMQGELSGIWESLGASAVFVSHQIDEAVFLADRVLVFTGIPGQLTADIHVDLPRPRDARTRTSPEFLAYMERIRGAVFGAGDAAGDISTLSEQARVL
jgi:NitT/TauT family transport system ATP-binding protein